MQNEVNGMVNIAILGFGTVGSGVAEVLTRNGGLIDGRVNNQVRLKYIMRARDIFEGPYKDLFVKDFSIIERDPEVSIVVETIGGLKPAYFGAVPSFFWRRLLDQFTATAPP